MPKVSVFGFTAKIYLVSLILFYLNSKPSYSCRGAFGMGMKAADDHSYLLHALNGGNVKYRATKSETMSSNLNCAMQDGALFWFGSVN